MRHVLKIETDLKDDKEYDALLAKVFCELACWGEGFEITKRTACLLRNVYTPIFVSLYGRCRDRGVDRAVMEFEYSMQKALAAYCSNLRKTLGRMGDEDNIGCGGIVTGKQIGRAHV